MVMDTLKETGVRMALNRYLQDIGEIQQLAIDPEAERISMEAALKGDIQQVHLELDYHLEPETLELRAFHCDREWIESALNRFAAGKRISIHNGAVEGVMNMLF